MPQPHYVRDYNKLMKNLLDTSDSKMRAMELAVGGFFDKVGALERDLMLQLGLSGQSYLVDVGCGSGRLASKLAGLEGLRYLGIDVVSDMLDFAQSICKRSDWRFEISNDLSIPEQDKQADFITFFSVFTHLKHNDILEERIKAEKQVERLSDDIKGIQDKIQTLMIQSKGQPRPMKLLNVQKIRALRLESMTKQQQASSYLKELSLPLLLEAMREHQKTKSKNAFIEKVLNSDIDNITDIIFSEDVKTAVKEGKIDDVKDRLKRVFAKADISVDAETQELLSAIDDLEEVDEETALSMAKEKARKVSEAPLKKAILEEEEE